MYMIKTVHFSSLGCFLAFFFLLVSVASADTVVRTGESVSIANDQIIEGDFYSAAGKVHISGEVTEDVIVAAGQATINGPVGNNAFLIAGRAEVHGTVGDDLRIIAGEITLAEPVMGDVLVIGGTVNILSTASISGDLLIFAGDVVIEGSVGGDVFGTAGNLRIDAPVTGDVDVRVERLTIADNARVEGMVRYVSNEVAVKTLHATVAGDLVRSDPVLPTGSTNVKMLLMPVLLLLFSVLIWYLISRRTLNLVVERALVKSPRPIFLGLAALLFTPIVILFSFVSMIGTLVGFAVLFGYLLMIVLSIASIPAVFGQLLMGAFSKSAPSSSLLSLIAGVVAIALLLLLPVIGLIALIIVMVIAQGAIVDLLVRSHK